MFKNPRNQNVIFAHRNSGLLPMQVICEPTCSEYELKPGSRIVFKSEVKEPREGIPPVETETHDYGLRLWFDHALYDPDAEIDGIPTEPFNWLHDKGEQNA
jgi:hypothetical protein